MSKTVCVSTHKWKYKYITVHELHNPVNAVSGERIDPLKHTETAKGIHTDDTS